MAQQCSEARPWQAWEIELLEKLSTQLAIAAHQAELEQQAEAALYLGFSFAGNLEAEKAVFAEIIQGNLLSQHETYWVTKSGDRHCILWSNTAIIFPSGSVEYALATGLDITERQLAQQQLKQLNEEL